MYKEESRIQEFLNIFSVSLSLGWVVSDMERSQPSDASFLILTSETDSVGGEQFILYKSCIRLWDVCGITTM